MKWKVEISKPAFEHLGKISDKRIRKKVFERIEQLEDDPDNQGEELKHSLSGLRSVRAVQRYRIVYKLIDEQVVVVVVAVGIRREGERSDIYRIAEQLIRTMDL